MFSNRKLTKNLEERITDVLDEMKDHAPTSDEYKALVDQLDKLYKIRTYKKANSVSMDTLISAGGSLGGIVAILGFERAHVITSKALGFVVKPKL